MSRANSTFSGHPTVGILEARPGLKLGPYELVEMLGQGGMGAVWKATDTQGRRTVALKFLPSDFRGNKEAMAQVRSSFQVSHALTHQHLCKVLALVDDDPQYGPFLVMEFVPGITLSDYRRRFAGGRVPLPQVVSILSRVAEALDYAHQKVFQTPDGEHKGVLHRDVKPQNIMLCLTGDAIADVSLIDIGLAAEIRTTATRFTQARIDTRGTRPYMSPEQLSGKRSQWDGRTDQYSLGVVAYELLAGHPPFEADDDAVLMHAIVNVQPDPINGLPGPVNAVLIRALAKKKDQRFSCCLEFIRALHNPGAVKPPQSQRKAQQKSGGKDDGVFEGVLEIVEDEETIAVAELVEDPAENGTVSNSKRPLREISPKQDRKAEEEARKQAEQKAWLAAQRTESAQAYEEYIASFPTGSHVDEAKDSRAEILRRTILEQNKQPDPFRDLDRELQEAQQSYEDDVRRAQEYYDDDMRDARRNPDFQERRDDKKDAERRKAERLRDASRELASKQETVARRKEAAQRDLTRRHASLRKPYLAVRTKKWKERDVADALQQVQLPRPQVFQQSVVFPAYALPALAVGGVLGLLLSMGGCYKGTMTVGWFFALPLVGAIIGGIVGVVLYFKAVESANQAHRKQVQEAEENYEEATRKAHTIHEKAAQAVGPLPPGNWPSVATACKVLLDQ